MCLTIVTKVTGHEDVGLHGSYLRDGPWRGRFGRGRARASLLPFSSFGYKFPLFVTRCARVIPTFFRHYQIMTKEINMSKKSTSTANANHKSNQGNSNKGTSGTNTAYAKAQGNKGAQMNPNKK